MNYTRAENLTRILSIDYGDSKIGLAISDLMHIIAKPYKTINNTSDKDIIKYLQNIIKNKSIEKIIVGLPITMKNKESKQTEKVNIFINMLENKIKLPIIAYDERLSSIEAKRSLIFQGIKTGYNKKNIDMTAAAIFLQSYLDENSNNKS